MRRGFLGWGWRQGGGVVSSFSFPFPFSFSFFFLISFRFINSSFFHSFSFRFKRNLKNLKTVVLFSFDLHSTLCTCACMCLCMCPRPDKWLASICLTETWPNITQRIFKRMGGWPNGHVARQLCLFSLLSGNGLLFVILAILWNCFIVHPKCRKIVYIFYNITIFVMTEAVITHTAVFFFFFFHFSVIDISHNSRSVKVIFIPFFNSIDFNFLLNIRKTLIFC